MAGTLWIMNCKNAIKWENTICYNLSTKIRFYTFCMMIFIWHRVLTMLYQNKATGFWYFVGGRMESPKHSWLSHLNKFKILFTGPSVCLVETLASIERKKNRWQKVLDNIWERILVHHTCIDTESIPKIGYYMSCIAHLNHIAHMLHPFIMK